MLSGLTARNTGQTQNTVHASRAILRIASSNPTSESITSKSRIRGALVRAAVLALPLGNGRWGARLWLGWLGQAARYSTDRPTTETQQKCNTARIVWKVMSTSLVGGGLPRDR
jgi:hypothetical protein